MSRRDKFLLAVGTFAAIVGGCLVPSLAIIMGQITENFDPRKPKNEILDAMASLSGKISLVGLGLWVAGYLYYGFW
jgi:ABC-type multidrug transport system fused ATPase/permease subunit